MLLLEVLYPIRRERLLMEPLDDKLLCRWFVGLNMDDPISGASTFSKNRERWLEGDVAHASFAQVLAQARERALLSDEHFTVDGIPIEAWAGQKSFKRQDAVLPSTLPDDPRNPSIAFRGGRRTNIPHASSIDPEACLDKKATGQEAMRAYMGPVLRENRHGLVVDTQVTQATGMAERVAALTIAEAIPRQQWVILGADKNDETRNFVYERRARRVTPSTMGRSIAIDGRTTRHPGDAVSHRKRQCVEGIFGWMKTIGLPRQTRHHSMARVGWMFTCTAAVYNLVRMNTLVAVA